MEGKLFSQDFLFDGIRSTPVWEALSGATMDTFHDGLKQIYAPLAADSSLNEANTEADIIEKVLGLLDWRDLTLKQVTATSTRRDDVPDFLLFAKDAPLEDEVSSILSQEFGGRSGTYYSILEAIANGNNTLSTMAAYLSTSPTSITRQVKELKDYFELIEFEMPFEGKRGIYKIRHPLIQFWFSQIYKN